MTEQAPCRSCGLRNEPGRDFCEHCGEYLSWAPTTHIAAVQAGTKETEAEHEQGAADAGVRGQAAAPLPDAPSTVSQPPAEDPAQGGEASEPAAVEDPPSTVSQAPVVPTDDALAPPSGDGPAAPPPPAPQPGGLDAAPPVAPSGTPVPPPMRAPAARGAGSPTALHGGNGVAPPPPAAQAPALPPPPPASHAAIAGLADAAPASGDASIVLTPEGATLGAAGVPAVEAGATLTYTATIRNESRLVDNYDIAVLGLPEGWTVVMPPTVFLVPLGAGRGESDQTVRLSITPPREYRSTAGIWTFEVVAMSRTAATVAARAISQFEVKPFHAWSVEVVPVVMSGRLKARYRLAVRNDGNGEQDLWLIALEESGRLRTRFGLGKLTLQPGGVGADVLTLRPRIPLPIGRTIEHRVGVDAVSTPPPAPEDEPGAKDKLKGKGKDEAKKLAGGVKVTSKGVQLPKPRLPKFQNPLKKLKMDASMLAKMRGSADPTAPLTARQVVFRQKPLIPLWLIGLIVLLVLIAAAIYFLWPREVRVPQLRGAKDTFAAEKMLREKDLVLSQPVQKKLDPAPPGTVIEQTPAPGAKVDKGSSVSIVVATSDALVEVPRLKGLTRVKADERLRDSGLELGETRPEDAADNFVVRSQIPDTGLRVARGTAVRVFLQKKPKPKRPKKPGGGTAGGPGGAAGGKDGGGATEVTIPPIDGRLSGAYAAALNDLGLKARVSHAIDPKREETVLGVDPKPGKKVKKGVVVKVAASAGPARLAVQRGQGVRIVDPKGPTSLGRFPLSGGSATELSYHPSGNQVVYRSGIQILLSGTARKSKVRRIYTGPDVLQHPSIAPNNRTIAVIRREEGDGDLCFATLGNTGVIDPLCLPDDGWDLDGRITWRLTGKTVMVFGRLAANPSIFGIRAYDTSSAFTTDPLRWRGRTATNVEKPGRGVLALAYAPGGTRLALISNLTTPNFQLVLAEPGDLLQADAKPTEVAACDVAWSPDKKNLAIVQSDAGCTDPIGKVLRLPAAKPKQIRPVLDAGSSPTFRPVR